MKNKIGLRKLSRTSAHRVAMLRTMVTQLVHHDRIKTTVPKAKELRRIADKMVTWAKIGVSAGSAGSATPAGVWATVALTERADASLPS